jgi:hypothetical protein
MTHNIANHRQSDGRRGACGSNFCRRFTNVAELFELGTPPACGFEPCVFIVDWLEYSGLVGRTWGYS